MGRKKKDYRKEYVELAKDVAAVIQADTKAMESQPEWVYDKNVKEMNIKLFNKFVRYFKKVPTE